MTLASGIAVYFIVWWVCLFAVLPFGVRNAHEAGETVEHGNEAGAPVKPMLLKKIIATTLLSAVVYALILGQMT
jgi:predicted secreted protein